MDEGVRDLILKKIETVEYKLNKIETKIDKNAENIFNLKLDMVQRHAICKEDCQSKINKLRLSVAKVIGVAAAGGIAGGGLEYVLKLF